MPFKSVWQHYSPSPEILALLTVFRSMVNEMIRVGVVNDAYSLRRLSTLCYCKLACYDIPSYYKLCAISRATGILAAMKKSARRGQKTRTPYAIRPVLVSCYDFKIVEGQLVIPIARGVRRSIQLTRRVLETILQPGVSVRSFTLTSTRLSLCMSRQSVPVECTDVVGVDRNLRNLTVGNDKRTVRHDLSRTVRIAHTTIRIVRAFKRNDARVGRLIASKYGRRRHDRIQHILHCTTRRVVAEAVAARQAIALEDITGIRCLYRRGNGQGRRHRSRMNGWSFSEVQRQIVYKAEWNGLPVVRLSTGETRGTSSHCPRCGERLQEDRSLKRKLWCRECRVMMDRDVVAAVNLSRRGRLRFDRSRAGWPQGGVVEAVKGNQTTTVIPGVDAPKLTYPTTS